MGRKNFMNGLKDYAEKAESFSNTHRDKLKYIYPVIIILFSFYILTINLNLPGAERIARGEVDIILQDHYGKQVQTRNPYLPASQKQDIIDELIEQRRKNPEHIKAVEERTERIRDYYSHHSGIPYVLGSDSHYYLRQAGNVLERDSIGEIIKGNQPYDNLQKAPAEIRMHPSTTPYLIATISKILDPTNPIEEKGAYWMSVFIGMLLLVSIYFAGAVLFGEGTGFIAAITATIHPGLYNVLKGGVADTTVISLFFSVFLVLLLVLSFKEAMKKEIQRMGYWVKLSLLAVSIISAYYLYSRTWTGHYYIIPLTVIFAASYLVLRTMKDFRKFMKVAIPTAIVLASAAYLLRNSSYALLAMNRLNLISPSLTFPSEWSHIRELQGLGLESYASLAGIFFLIVSVFGLMMLARKQINETDAGSFVVGWSAVIILPLLSGRFIFYALLPLIFLFAYGTVEAGKLFSAIRWKIPKAVKTIIFILAIMILFSSWAFPITKDLSNELPRMDDAIFNVSHNIQARTTSDSIITTWWDYGYIYENYADRGVIMDGGSLDTYRLYWSSRALMSKDENLTLGIMRMLNCGNERKAMNAASGNPDEAVKILESSLKMDEDDVSEYYEEKSIPDVLQYTHCDSRPGILMASSDMIRTIPTMLYYSEWDFSLGMTRMDEPLIKKGTCSGNSCSGGIQFNLKKGTAEIQGRNLSRLIHVEADFNNLTVIENEDGTDLSALIVGNDLYILSKGLEESILMRALFLNDFNNLELVDYTDARKRIVAYRTPNSILK